MALDQREGYPQLLYRLKGLGMACTVLHLGAHPDDEHGGLLSYLAHKTGVRIVYWSATRGESGQNRIGAYIEEALGVYRTWESLAARAEDGAECLFGPFYDFGFSKNGDEALTKWGKVAVVREIVRAIRLVQPQIVVARWDGTPNDGHGHHQAIGQASLEAFEAAGQADRFPELQSPGLAAWQPLKFYHSTGGDWEPGEEGAVGGVQPKLERDGMLRLNTGEFDPIANLTCQEQALIALNKHQSQAMGFIPEPGDFYYYYSLHTSLVPTPARESHFFDGLDPSLTSLANYPGNGSLALSTKLAHVKAKASEALREFRADDPLPASAPLLEGLSALREIRADLSKEGLSSQPQQALDVYLARKIDDFEAVATLCLGLRLQCLSDHSHIIPGQQWNKPTAKIQRH